MIEEEKFKLLKKIVSEDDLENLANSLVIHNGNGYELFGEYLLYKSHSYYKLEKYKTHGDRYFYNMRNAVIYATLDKQNKVFDAQRVAELDKMLEGAVANGTLHQTLYKKSKNLDNKALYYAKLSEDSEKRRKILNQLDTYALQVKNWQYRKFSEASK